ncbi:MAG TPA: DinB family protein, partial [Candidatus Limnocylindrales bacterium]
MEASPALAAFPDWPQYASRISRSIAALSAEQLALRASPDHAPVWLLAAHLASVRMYWLCMVCGEPGLETTDVIDPRTDEGWDDLPEHPRSAEELVGALDASWAVVADCLQHWTPEKLQASVERQLGDITQR